MKWNRTVTLGLTTVLAAIVTLTGCAGRAQNPAPTQQGGGSQPFAGVNLRFMAANHPWADTIKNEIPAFEAATGMKVTMEPIAEAQLTQKLTVELTAGGGTVDVFMQRPLQEARQFQKNGWYADLNTFIKDTAKTPADYDVADFFKGPIESETVGGSLVGIPVITEQQIIYYRKDLFQQNNIKVPTTMVELESAARQLHQPDKQVGIVLRGQGNPAVSQFSSFLYSMGGEFIKENKFVIDSPEAIKAFELYGRLLGKYGPTGALNMSWPQAAALFAQGKAALWVDANSLYLNVTDPSKSQVADKVGFAQFPAGDSGSQPYSVTSWGLSIAKSSKNQAAAWEFVKWATSKAIALKTQAAGNPSARTSVWNHAEGTKAWPAEWVAVAKKEAASGRPADRPLLINVGQARDLIGEVLTAAITGKDVAATARDRNVKLNAILASEK